MKTKTQLASALVFLFGLLMDFTWSDGVLAEEGDEAYAKGGAQDCMECHDTQPTTLVLHTPHAMAGDARTPFASQECESCHGPSSDHMRKVPGELIPPPPKVVFGQNSITPIEDQNEVCMSCHEGGLRINWTGSEHHSGDVACATCHTVHALKDPVLVKQSQDEVCYACHVEQKAQSFRRSRHPIKEGKVTCSDCHNPHGSFGPTLLKYSNVNETCYSCHTEKRGPFLWEHAPVRDDCTNCHTPHGSSQPRLLKIRTPYLCQQCHIEAFHPSTLYSGDDILPFGAGERILAKGCLNCHPKVHGSNHPGGVRLTR